MHKVLKAAAAAVSIFVVAVSAGAETVVIEPMMDTTIYQEGNLSNGAGAFLFSGTTQGGNQRRALMAFDIAAAVPSGATITEVSLTLRVSRTNSGAQTIGLHRATAAWGEGSSDAPGQEGSGTTATAGDATWMHRFFPDDAWSSPGGDFIPSSSADQQVAGTGSATWDSTSMLINDVQGWLDDPSGNFGWIVVMSSGGTAKRFNSRENADQASRPGLTVDYVASVQSPTASFSFDPTSPTAGEEVAFTDTSTGEPTSWDWDFGDGDMSTAQNPTHVFDVAGVYTVELTATNAGGSDSTSLELTVTGDAPNLDSLFFVAAAAKAAGAEGAFFLTDLDVNNSGSTAATYRFLWLPRAQDNSIPTASDTFTLAAGATVRYEDVLGSVFGFGDGAVGALAVISDSGDLLLMSRTFNLSDEGTFGQSIPGEAASELIGENQRRRVLFFTENGDFRSNLGILNGVGTPITVRWERFLADGTSIDTASVDLAGWSNVQLNRVFDDVSPVEAAYVDVWTATPGGAFSAYGSVLDNLSSDPTTVLPQ